MPRARSLRAGGSRAGRVASARSRHMTLLAQWIVCWWCSSFAGCSPPEDADRDLEATMSYGRFSWFDVDLCTCTLYLYVPVRETGRSLADESRARERARRCAECGSARVRSRVARCCRVLMYFGPVRSSQSFTVTGSAALERAQRAIRYAVGRTPVTQAQGRYRERRAEPTLQP